jgi:hypothetical protein
MTKWTPRDRNVGAMTGTTRRRRAARGYLARLVAMVAVLAGLALAHGLQCTDGMTVMPAGPGTGMPVGVHGDGASAIARIDGVSMNGVAPVDTDQRHPDGHPAVFVPAGDSTPGSTGLGGVLAACLAIIVAVVVAAAGSRPTGFRIVVRMLRSVRVPVASTALPRAPSLSALCLLRI